MNTYLTNFTSDPIHTRNSAVFSSSFILILSLLCRKPFFSNLTTQEERIDVLFFLSPYRTPVCMEAVEDHPHHHRCRTHFDPS